MDFRLDLNTHDIVFVNGGCPVVQEKAEIVAQRLKIRLLTFLNEWFINVNYGVPYMQRILGKKVAKETVDQIMQENILQEAGVSEILTFDSTLKSREYSLVFKVKCKDNTSVVVALNNLGV